ncbi:hypothetical protein [Paractinoplanes rishiriensis]|uniref:hypothetical protein n=1 Tax=Paractinoplanes rishiriensis TaxID=1050105 RepID=UPI003F68F7F6
MSVAAAAGPGAATAGPLPVSASASTVAAANGAERLANTDILRCAYGGHIGGSLFKASITRKMSPGSSVPGEDRKMRTLTGIVTAGVEPGCLLLDDYLLVGGDREVIRAGARLEVTGRVVPDLMTTCQQGTPFVVASARPVAD